MISRKIFALSFIFFCLLLNSCTVKKSIIDSKDELKNAEYYSYFTDASRQALIYGNFSDALVLYNRCITLFPQRSAPYYQISNIYLSLNDINKGKYYAKKAVGFDEKNTWYLLHLANIYQYENNNDSLIILYEKLIKLDNNPEHLYNLAVFYSRNGNFKESLKQLQKLENEYFGAKEILLMKHKNYSSLSMKDSALIQLEKVVKLFPDDVSGYGLLAEYLSEIQRYESADSIYREILKKEPLNGLANISFGDHFFKLGNTDSALHYFKIGFAADDLKLEDKIGVLFNFMYHPVISVRDTVLIWELITVLKNSHNDPRPYTLAAEFKVKKREFREAVNELKKAIELNSDAYIVWEQYIMINNYLQEHSAVADIYNEAIEKFKNEIKLYIYSGYSLYALKEYNKVISLALEACEIDTIAKDDKVQIFNLLADSYRQLENYVVSDSLYEEILKFDPENLFIRNNYGYYLSLRGEKLERAEELSSLTVRREPKNATYLDTYGWILFKMGRIKEALKYIESAIQNGAYTNSEVLEHYGDIMYELKRCNEAIEAWGEALKHSENGSDIIKEKINSASENCSNK